MAHSGTKRHRDRDQGARSFEAVEALDAPGVNRVFRMTQPERQQIAECLRQIDRARQELERQQNPDNRGILKELRASADRIYDLINELDQADN